MTMLTQEAVQKHIRVYILVFIALAVLTVVTVAVSYLNLPLKLAILVALSVATLKSSLVAGFFMHLVSEKKIIFWILALAFCFFIFLIAYPSLHHY